MNGGLLHAASALDMLGKMQDIRAQNIANANTTGYRRRIGSAEAFASSLKQAGGVRLATLREDVDSSQGNLRQTGAANDLALEGKGFFSLETEQGVRFTRNGAFHVHSSGDLVASDGARVLGEGGPIQVDPGRGPISVDERGNVTQENERVATLRVVEFEQQTRLQAEANGRWRAGPGANPTDAKETTVRQGFLESSNVNVVDELVQMISGLRAFESAQKSMQGIDRIRSRAVGGR